MAVSDVLNRQLLFVTGKGGVGKTTVASALAVLAAQRGKRVLLCEMDGKGAIGDALDAGPVRFVPTTVAPGLHVMSMNTEDALAEYLRLFVRLPLVGKLGPLARTFDFVADAAPGVKEILAVGKLCYEVREHHYDVVVVDAEASGHVVAQLGAPRVIRELVHVGLVRDQTEWMIEILGDPRRTGVVVVSTPEEMPVAESADLIERISTEAQVDVAAVVVNRMLPSVLARGQLAALAALDGDEARAWLVQRCGAGVDVVLDSVALAQSRSRVAAVHAERLAALAGSLPVLSVPEQFTKSGGRRVINLVADALSAGVT